jgi:hypothetical protein
LFRARRNPRTNVQRIRAKLYGPRARVTSHDDRSLATLRTTGNALEAEAKRHNVSVVQLALAWLLQKSSEQESDGDCIAQYSSVTKFKEESYPVQLCIELALESAVLWSPAVHAAGIGQQRTIFHRQIRPADDAIAPEERQRVVT